MKLKKTSVRNWQDETYRPRLPRLQSKIFSRSLLLLAVVLSLASIVELLSLLANQRREERISLIDSISESKPYMAYGAWQQNTDTILLTMRSVLKSPSAKISSYKDSYIEYTITETGYGTQDWGRCDEIITIDFKGYALDPESILPEGQWKTCYVSSINFDTLWKDMLIRILPILVVAVLLSFAFSRIVRTLIVDPLQRLAQHISAQKPLEDYERSGCDEKPDEFDELVNELKTRTYELNKERSLIEKFFPEITDAIIQVDNHYKIIRHNEALSDYTGVPDLKGAYLDQFFPNKVLIADGTRKKFTDSKGNILEFKASTLRNNEGIIYFVRDITEERKQEEQQNHSAKLRALGTLAGGIAHDYNNLLAVIISNAEALASGMTNKKEHQELLDSMIHAASRGASLSNQLLTFAQKRSVSTKIINANDVVENVYSMVQSIIGRKQEIKLQLSSKAKIEIDIGLIESALVNLILNAKDALPKGGTISISVKDVVKNDQKYVVYIVEDNGIGMPAEVLERVRDPFFTTKSLGKGTGLGLSIVSSFAEQFGGFLDLESVPNEGTSVSLYLPPYKAKKRRRNAEKTAPNPFKVKPRNLLLIDDEESLCKVLSTILSFDGHNVATATSYAEFMKKQLYKNTYELVICDVQLEKETAYDVWQMFEEHKNSPPFALISGNIPDEVRDEIDQMDCKHILMKPFHNQDFTKYVTEILIDIYGSIEAEADTAKPPSSS